MGEEAKNTFQSLREWVVDHKLRTVGNLSLSLSLIILCVYMGFWLLAWIFMGFGMNFSFVEGCLWLSGIAGSIAYNWSQPNMKTSVKIIHARLHAQALTLAALAGAAVVEYYDHRTGAKQEHVARFLGTPQKD
ncbi:hypothetical protein RHSIM_Rhsim02G0008300 [Rhododendron simsii]|uniref:HIG1 domain-containing protein n=1 Tax=Rhododendron simsii TaxID=118357 RepID=A0A834LU11_RHOSS|nr:hypothetical protein RHSIM_Rhsim02G0008300 [Rhododendron simsii]